MIPFLLSLLVLPAAWAKEPLVKSALPALYTAFAERLGETEADRYFDTWTAQDVHMYQSKAQPLLVATSSRQKRTESLTRLWARHAGLGSVFGEIEGNHIMRAQAERIEGTVYLDELTYYRLNPKGSRPDGINYQIRGEKLVITRILESKTNGTYKEVQAKRYLAQWRGSGLTVIDGPFRRTFTGENIELYTGGVYVPVALATPTQLRSMTLLVGTTPSPRFFDGAYQTTAFDKASYSEFVYDYIRNLLSGRPTAPQKRSFRGPIVRTPEEIAEFRSALRAWVLLHETFPKAHGKSGLEMLLAKEISRRGGQAKVFIDDLDDRSREILANAGGLPAAFPLENALLRADPNAPGVLSSLRFFFAAYPARALLLRERLIHANAAWLGLIGQQERSHCLELLLRKAFERPDGQREENLL